MRDRPTTISNDPLLRDAPGREELLLGNEAIVRGAIEAGVAYASGYPGTPSSEITDAFARISRHHDLVFEYSVNEKIAIETAFGASLAGARSICSMKHLGLMVGGDPLSTIPYVGVVGGMVIVSAADPSCLTSPNEQDQRHLGPMLHLPVLDPSTPQEALELTRYAFDLSERARLPVLLRPTTRLCHSRGIVRLGPMRPPEVKGFERDRARFNPVPAHARKMRRDLKERMALARSEIASASLVRRTGSGPLGVLASGVPAATTADLLDEAGLAGEVAQVSTPFPHPLAEAEIAVALEGIERLLVVEELSPFLEDAITLIAARRRLDVEILGKQTGHFPEEFEYTPDVIRQGLRSALGLEIPEPVGAEPVEVPVRPPVLCAGCPHTATYAAARAAFRKDQLYFNDIGCYTLGYDPPQETSDALLCMGAGFTLAASVARVTGKRTVGFLGDSTFFHSGMPALLDAIKEGVSMVAVVLDNDVTAMTGFQESPTVELQDGSPRRRTSIEAVVRGLGAEHVEKIDPFEHEASVAAFKRARDAEGLAVVISEHACPVYIDREAGPSAEPPLQIERELCVDCWMCYQRTGCPAFTVEEGVLRIDEARCTGCHICTSFCPTDAIVEGDEG